MSLFWRIFALNAVVLGSATALLLWAPVTVSVPVVLTEAVILVAGLAVMLVANAALLRIGLAPLDRLTRLMATVDLLRPGQRLPERGRLETAELIRAFNAMLERLEHERASSSARVLLAQEAERRRIAQELHDEVGQSMTAILLALERTADDADEPLRGELRQMQEITRGSLDEVGVSCAGCTPRGGAARSAVRVVACGGREASAPGWDVWPLSVGGRAPPPSAGRRADKEGTRQSRLNPRAVRTRRPSTGTGRSPTSGAAGSTRTSGIRWRCPGAWRGRRRSPPGSRGSGSRCTAARPARSSPWRTGAPTVRCP
ncbi:histidine kinase [Streptomyces sp. NPDC020597]|uniref:histidine kinase n=1 Tax=unclassified Streptomyces TaxID=2593676 RepID=UPI0037B29896